MTDTLHLEIITAGGSVVDTQAAQVTLPLADGEVGILPGHAPLLGAPDGRTLSQREGDLNREALRQTYTPEQLTGKLAKLAGLRQTDAPVTAIELAADFSWDKVPKQDICLPEGLF